MFKWLKDKFEKKGLPPIVVEGCFGEIDLGGRKLIDERKRRKAVETVGYQQVTPLINRIIHNLIKSLRG